jgi:DNA-directed RNA polymerase specialized sigma24 family protein
MFCLRLPTRHRILFYTQTTRIAKAHPDRNRASLAAHDTGEYSYAQIAQQFGVHFTTVGRIVRAGRSFRREVKD